KSISVSSRLSCGRPSPCAGSDTSPGMPTSPSAISRAGSTLSGPSLAATLRRDQRFRNGSSSFILARSGLALAQHLDRLLAELVLLGLMVFPALPLDEGFLGVVLGHERLKELEEWLRHGDGADDLLAHLPVGFRLV